MTDLKKTIVRGFIFGAILVVVWWIGNYNGVNKAQRRYSPLLSYIACQGKVGQVVNMISREYVDSISTDSLDELLLPAIMAKFDPHSVYIPAREFTKAEEPLQGEFDGIGVVFNNATDTVVVLSVIPSGPSQKAGIVAGDRIIKVNDTLIAGQKMATDAIMKRLRGPRGTKVKLSLKRSGISSLVGVEVTRGAIPLHSVEATIMLSKDIGFIRLSQFALTSHAEILKAIDTLRKSGMKKLIFDLRSNSGGFLEQAIFIANEFLPVGKLIVYTEDRHHNRQNQYSNGHGTATDIDMAVLIDEASASSSEILAGALQDNDRATIIGRRSFGKGLVQTQTQFSDGSALRLTTARYFTPTGRSIQKPFKAGDREDYEMDLVNRFTNNEFFTADSIKFADSLRFTTPKGKVVYGGGGIMPDIFVPLDTTRLTKYATQIIGKNILYRYTLAFTDSHRHQIDAVKTIADVKRLFSNSGDMVGDMVEYGVKQGVARPSQTELEQSAKLFKAQIQGYVARNTPLGDGAFYYFIMPIDQTLNKAVQTLK